MKRSPSSCPDVLLARASRDLLSPEEEAHLAMHLQHCASCRVAALVAADFERVSTVVPADDQLIARVTSRIVRRPSTVARRRTWLVSLIAAALLAFGAAAAASLSARSARSPSTAALANVPPPSIPAPSIGSVGAPTRLAGSALEGEIESVSATPEPAKAAQERSPVAPVARPRDRDRPDPVEMTPMTLFAEANRLRGAGQVSEAIARYRLLQGLFPHSVETTLSRLSTGNLLMGRNDAEAALEQFKAYLSADPSGVLCEEALFGKARALRALGRSVEERETWNALLSAYPGSVYGPVARAREQELR